MSARSLRSGLTVSAVAASIALAPSASAHDTLISSNPKNGAQLTSAPTQIELTFSESVLKVGNQIAVKAPDGSTATTTPTTSGAKVSVPFKAAGNGSYQVTWRVTSADGHPVSGRYTFTLKGASSGSTSAAATKPASSQGSAGIGGPQTTVKGPSSPTTSMKGDNKPWLVFGGTVAALAALAVAFVVARKRVKGDPR